MTPEPDDLAEALLGIDPASPLGALRRQRPDILRHTEGAYRALVTPDDPGGGTPAVGGVSLAERAALALRVALIERHEALAGHYRSLLATRGTPEEQRAAEAFPALEGDSRLAALLRYADLVAQHPARADQAEIDHLSNLGLSPQDIVAVTQLVAFVPYQTRLFAGLRLLQREAQA